LRIALIGQAAFGEKVLTELHARGEEIVHVFTPPDKPGGKPDPIKAKALELNVPVSQPASFKTEQAFEHFKTLKADLGILAFVTLIVPERILYLPTHKSICFHPSLLPRHRGASAINWALIQGDSETGVTVFWPDQGIDTGPILVQKRTPIQENDTVGSLYFERLFPLGIEAIIESVELIKAGRAPAIQQDESLATYEPICRDEHARIDFSRSAREVYNLVRGCDPQPGAWCELAGRRFRLYAPALETAAHDVSPGTVVDIDESGMRVALRHGTLRVARVRVEPGKERVSPRAMAASGELSRGVGLT
jgi:methionyl-tRNA formyltransferase